MVGPGAGSPPGALPDGDTTRGALDPASVLAHLGDAVVAADTDGVIRYANDAVTALLGWTPAELVGQPLATIIPPALRPAHRSAFRRYVADRTGSLMGRLVHMPALAADGREVGIEMLLSSACSPDGEHFVLGSLRDVERRVEGERETALAMHLLRVLAEARTLREGTAKILQVIAETLGWDLAVLWVVDRPAGLLRVAEAWCQPTPALQDFDGRTRDAVLRPGAALPGRVWEERRSLWLDDVTAQPGGDRAVMAGEAGLRAQCAFPIFSSGDVIGVIELLGTAAREVDALVLGAAASIARPLGEFVDRMRVEEELHFQEAVHASQSEATIDGILVVAPNGTFISFNRRFVEMWGIPDEVIASRSDDAAVAFVSTKVVDPDGFRARVAHLYEHPYEDSRDEIVLTDGRTFDRWSAPLRRDDGGLYGRAWYFRDVTEEKGAGEELAASRARAAFLADASATLAASLDVETTLREVADLMVPRLADWCLVHVPSPRGVEPTVVVHLDRARAQRLLAVQRRVAAEPDPAVDGVGAVLRSGRPLLYPEIDDRVLRAVARTDEHYEALRAAGFRSAIVMPMVARGRIIGVLTLAMAESGRTYTQADLVLAEDVARRAALAVDNARLYREQVDVARTLQESLLPSRLPAIAGLDLAACYRPAGEGSEVGGDFYDVFETTGGEWGVVVGDVCGKGTDAAALTALARHTVRTAAMHRRAPRAVLGVVNEAILRLGDDERFCTIAYGRLTVGEGAANLVLACGGHPLPLVLRSDGRVEEAACAGSALGVRPDPDLPERRARLGRGDALVLVTDGVAEARSEGELFGDERLAAALAECRGQPAAAIVEHLERKVLEFTGGPVADDLAVLVLRVPEA